MYFLVYGLLYLLSLLPFWFLYAISDLLYVLIYYIIGYRKKIVMANLESAFPEKTPAERIKIAKKFYHYLCDNFIEVLKLLSISERAFLKRCTGDFDAVNKVAASGKNIQLHSGHQFNSEYGIWFYSKDSILPIYGMYVKVTNNAINRLFLKIRGRYGTVMIEAAEFRNKIHSMYKNPYLFGWVADQNPSNPRNAYWLKFLNKVAPFVKTPERSAIKNNVAVVFARIKKIKRGYYYFENIVVTENASEYKMGELTRLYRDFLEDTIRQDPANYLWTHRRWKHKYKDEYKELWIEKDSV